MKKKTFGRLLFILCMSLIFTQVNAQTIKLSEKKVDLALKNCRVALNSNVDGLVESAMSKIILFNRQYPDVDYNKVISALDKLTINGKTTIIKHKAFLTKIYIQNPDLFQSIRILNKENENENFKLIISKLENEIFASN